jgi:hypothetical protein
MHDSNPPTTASGTPRPIENAADARTAIGELTQVMEVLESVVLQETKLVRAGELRKATVLGSEKSELSGRYFKAVERLKANRKLLSCLVPQDLSALTRRHEVLQAALKTNLVVLATAHAVSEGIVRRLSSDLARKAAPQIYGASGKATAPDPKRTQPLAFSRML